MSRATDRLEYAHGNFNVDFRQVRKYVRTELDKEKKPSPEGEAVLELLDSLDGVLDELVSSIIVLERKVKKLEKK